MQKLCKKDINLEGKKCKSVLYKEADQEIVEIQDPHKSETDQKKNEINSDSSIMNLINYAFPSTHYSIWNFTKLKKNLPIESWKDDQEPNQESF